MTAEPTAASLKVDGRRLRAKRTRAAIVDGLLALIEEGDLKPTAPRIAHRAGVSLRTVFQHFEEVEALFAAVSERQVERIAEMVVPVDSALPLPERFEAFVAQRCRVLEAITPIARAAQLQEPLSPSVRAEADRLRQLGRDGVLRAFAPELEALEGDRRERCVAALSATTAWRMWEVLRAEQGRDVQRAEELLRYQVAAILASAGFDVAG